MQLEREPVLFSSPLTHVRFDNLLGLIRSNPIEATPLYVPVPPDCAMFLPGYNSPGRRLRPPETWYIRTRCIVLSEDETRHPQTSSFTSLKSPIVPEYDGPDPELIQHDGLPTTTDIFERVEVWCKSLHTLGNRLEEVM